MSAATAIAVATPALAAGAQSTEPADALRVVSPGSPAAIAIRDAQLAREEQKERVARRERRNAGPFVPVVGKVDYGTSENAFGAARSGHVHSGHDMFAPAGTPIVAATDGVIAEAGSDGGQGNYVYLYDSESDQTYVYMHMIEPAEVKAGDEVEAGRQLGGVGCTGSCYGDHLHFEIREGKGYTGEAHDPLPELEKWDSLSKPE
ncbi:MAG TPA: M23 family metallopeptidase [Solirubrobacterales bacterium]|nr:M23 family metallopeptidase [Solirubrobacterales bacterium]